MESLPLRLRRHLFKLKETFSRKKGANYFLSYFLREPSLKIKGSFP
jgi:hypothetical protein